VRLGQAGALESSQALRKSVSDFVKQLREAICLLPLALIAARARNINEPSENPGAAPCAR